MGEPLKMEKVLCNVLNDVKISVRTKTNDLFPDLTKELCCLSHAFCYQAVTERKLTGKKRTS